MMGHIAEWYYSGIAGIRPLLPGFRKILIRPYLPEDMNHFCCRYESASGEISVEAAREGDRILLTAEAAEGIEMEIQTDLLEQAGRAAVFRKP